MSEHVPAHVGLILDGNRRWAKRNGLPLVEGHRQGYKTLRKVLDVALESGVQYVSAFVFSTENWRRTQEEVGYLMDLTLRIVTNDLEELHKKGIKVAWVGSEDRVSDKLRQAIRNAEALTKENTGGTLALCFNYGGQREIADAVQRMCADKIAPDEITEEKIAEYLYHPEVPPIDLLIRTSGEQRLSNFMLWRAAYSELYFVDKQWPDFTPEDFHAALREYAARGRRFGK